MSEPDTSIALRILEKQIMGAIAGAKEAGVPQGQIVAILHGHAHQETEIMIDRGEDPK